MIAGSDEPMSLSKWYHYWNRLYDMLSCNYPDNNYFTFFQAQKDKAQQEQNGKRLSHFVTWDSSILQYNPFLSSFRCCKPHSFSLYVRIAAVLRSKHDEAVSTSDLYKEADLSGIIGMSAFRKHVSYWERLGLIYKMRNKPNEATKPAEGAEAPKKAEQPKKAGSVSAAEPEWKLHDRKLSNILDIVSCDDLYTALSFFSNTLPFGSVGINLLRRLGYNETAVFDGWDKGRPNGTSSGRYEDDIPIGETAGIFRFKHAYMSQSLNDYNAIDLLHAIEHKKWCRINYRHPIRLSSESMICYPIQIRSSADDGRQYVFCFEPTTHTLSFMRLDYIESVELIKHIVFPPAGKSSSEEMEYRIRLLGKSCSKVEKVSGKHLYELYSDELENAKEWVNYCWGVSAYSTGVEISRPQTQHICVTFTYDPVNEKHIRKRIIRERRIGKIANDDTDNGIITFEVDLIDYVELCKWLQSFFCRIDIASVEPENIRNRLLINFNLTDQIYSSNCFVTGMANDPVSQKTIPKGVRLHCFTAYHEQLFNEFMSDCSEYIVYSVSSGQINADLPYGWYHDESEEDIKNLSKYCSTNNITLTHSRFYRSILPLLTVEKRWLLSMLESPWINLFFKKRETDSLKNMLLLDGIRPLYTKDSYEIFGQHRDIEDMCADVNALKLYSDTFLSLKNAVRNEWPLNIRYKTQYYEATGKELSGTFAPLWLEYSMRENRFRFFCYRYDDSKIYSLNLDRFADIPQIISSITPALSKIPAGQPSERAGFSRIISYYYTANQTYVTVRFTDFRNTPDRILNEFSAYRKQCIKDPSSGIYTLTIWFNKLDYKDIAIRLMSYAGTVLVDSDDESGVYKDIRARLDAQKALNDKAVVRVQTKEKD